MTVRKIDGKWYADFRFQRADGRAARIRKRSPMQSGAGAEQFDHQLRTILHAPTRPAKEVRTFSVFAEEFMKSYVVANNKRSEQEAKACILRNHLIPAFGAMLLDEIKMHPIELLKSDLLARGESRKRVNNVLACLGKIEATLRYASKRAGLRHIGSRTSFATHVLLASRDAGSITECDTGARRTLDARDDAPVHAPCAECARGSDRAPELWAAGGQREKDGSRNNVI